ncbi:MAG TPA: alginate lyase family protein [Burkholderiales bacterium]
MSATLDWKLNRLRTMGAAEVCWRVGQAVVGGAERLGIGLADVAADVGLGRGGPGWIAQAPRALDAAPYIEAAERVLAGSWEIFALRDRALGFPPHWNRDPKTGVEAPLEFGKGIDYRNERRVGNIKYLWELNRHLELVTLAQAWHLTGEKRFALAARLLLESWIEQCPYPRGANWSSALEVGIRLVNWACAWHLFGGEHSPLLAGADGARFRRRWIDAVYRHCHFLARNRSRHSSANNHLFGELAALFVASTTWPCWADSPRWRATARRGLEAEAARQNNADGTNREQALWYQHEVADMMLLCRQFALAAGEGFALVYDQRLEALLDFIAAAMDRGGHVPALGDADDGVLVRFSREAAFCPYRSLLASGAVLFGRGDFKAAAGRFDDKSRWLLGDAAQARFDALPAAAARPARRAFRDGGYYVLGRNFGAAGEVKAVVDAGPLGFLSIAAHGHADALALTLSIDGREFLVDPGTYAYHGERRWRDYFRGTAAHNTVCVDGLDQSVPGGAFLWLRHARAWCERFDSSDERDSFEGAHDGYRRLVDPVLHRRRIDFDKRALRIEVRDTLECAAAHAVQLHWHLAERCAARLNGRTVEVERDGLRLRIDCPRELEAPQLVAGREAPPLGWISRRFDEKSPATVAVCAGRIYGRASLLTALTITLG